MINPLVSTLIKGMLYLILKAKQGGKYLSRKQVIDKRTGRKTWKYKYKPMQQRAAHEVTRNKFEKVTKLSGDEHKNQIEHALQNGVRVSLHVLKDYPDLVVKYHQQARMAKAEKIRAKVKAHIAEIKNVPKVDDSVSIVENNFDTMPETENKEAYLLTKEEVIKERDFLETNWKGTPKQEQRMSDLARQSMIVYKTPLSELKDMPESKPKPAIPAFKLEQEDITSKEKNTRFNDAQGGLFGKKPTTHESYAKKDLKPALKLEGNETITSLVTAVKSALMSEGLDTRAREFVDKAFKEKDLASLKKMASEYVDMKESAQVSSSPTENKGSEEKKMFNKETLEKEFNDYNDVWEWTGSEKQIAWAEKIKKEKMNDIIKKLSEHTPNYIENKRGRGVAGEAYQDQMLNLRKNFKILSTLNSANFWILHKDASPERFGEILFDTVTDNDGAISVNSHRRASLDEIRKNIQNLKSQFKKS